MRKRLRRPDAIHHIISRVRLRRNSAKNKIQYLSDRNPYSLRNVVSEKLQVPKAKTELSKKTFTYSGPKLWNGLPFWIRQASSHNAFKTKVKRLILNDVP